jgi:dCTP deaminase
VTRARGRTAGRPRIRGKSTGAEPRVTRSGSLLSDMQILERLVAKDESLIFVTPLIDPATQVGPSSLDLRVGTELYVTRVIASTDIDLSATKAQIEQQTAAYFSVQRVGRDRPFVLHPGEFALASSLEYLRLPLDIAGRLEGRSSMGRLGLQVHATAGFVDPGFEGTLTFELINAGKLPVRFGPGLRLGQICFIEVKRVEVGYMERTGRKYGRVLGVELPRVHQDPEIRLK